MKPVKKQYEAIFSTDVATIGLRFDGSNLIGIDYLKGKQCKTPVNELASNVKNKIETYLDAQSKIKNIDVKVELNVTPFQGSVLKQLQRIPYGETRTYGDIAKILNTSPRAVGNACRKNPVPIVIPCHRVVASKGLGGYSGETEGETLDIKYQLLKLEGVF